MSDSHPPSARALSNLRPRDSAGFFYVLLCIVLSVSGIWLSMSSNGAVWVAGQVILSAAMLQWFILLHEAGHKTLFRTKSLNTFFGYIAGFSSGLPFSSWSIIHFRHHKWTGWQDLDATTASLVPRKLNKWERVVINASWRLWIPVFALIYRFNNYWNYPRLVQFVPKPEQRRHIAAEIFILVVAYACVVVLLGPATVLSLFGLAIVLSLIVQEFLLLSQHTHIPTNISHGEDVRPFLPAEQAVFTRSLRFPSLISRFLLMHFDAHELHHMYVRVPGYDLRKISYETENEVDWWEWARRSKRLSGETFLFKNRAVTGFSL